MDSHRSATGGSFLHRVGYLMALALIVLPLSDIALGIMPLQFDSIRWRVGAAGLVTGALLLPVSGLLLALAISHLREHRITQYVLASCAGVTGLLLIVVLGFFVLDTLQLRNEVNPQRVKLYDRAAMKGILSQLVLIAALIWMGVGSIRASLAVRRAERQRKKEPVMVARVAELRRPKTASALD